LQKLNGVKTYIYPVTDHQIKKMIEFQNTKCIKATIPQLKELTGLTNNQITWRIKGTRTFREKVLINGKWQFEYTINDAAMRHIKTFFSEQEKVELKKRSQKKLRSEKQRKLQELWMVLWGRFPRPEIDLPVSYVNTYSTYGRQ